MILEHFRLSYGETNCYILGDERTGEALLIDPGVWDPELPEYLEKSGLTLRYILLTHNHGDHTGGLGEARQYTHARVAGSPLAPEAELTLRENDSLVMGNLQVRVLETPGHTPDSLSFLAGGNLFCGDTLFAGSVGGTPSLDQHDRLVEVIKTRILTYSDETLILPGHGPATSVRIERLFNPFLIA